MYDVVKTTQLVVAESNVRKNVDFESEDFKDLVENVKRLGVRIPLEVRANGKTVGGLPQYEIISGQRRYEAAKRAGIENLAVLKEEYESDLDAILASATENLHRKDLSPIEAGAVVRDLMAQVDEEGNKLFKDKTEVAQFLNISRARLSAWLATDALPERVKELTNEGKVRAKTAERIAQGIKDKDAQVELAEELAKSELSGEEQVKAVKAVKRGEKPKEAVAKSKKAKTPPPELVSAEQKEELISELKELDAPKTLVERAKALEPADEAGYHELLDELVSLRTPTELIEEGDEELIQQRTKEADAEGEMRAREANIHSAPLASLLNEIEHMVTIVHLKGQSAPHEWVPSHELQARIAQELLGRLKEAAPVKQLEELPVEE